jgi:hypothetical protein
MCHSSFTQPPDVSKFKNDKFLAAIKRLQLVYAETGSNWLRKIGCGIICVRSDGIAEKTLVGYYWGRMSASCSACCFCALSQTLESHNLSGLRRKLQTM